MTPVPKSIAILHLSGSLVVKDGPYESWFNRTTAGSVGQYSMGHQVGAWTECNRFLHCEKQQYETVFPERSYDLHSGQSLQVTFENGKYSIDFASCRSTWITQTIRPDPVSLNIDGDKLYGCQISYLPQSSESGGGGDYSCEVPFTVGRREFSTLDLRKELHQLGFPEFCYEKFPTDALLVRDGVWNIAECSGYRVRCCRTRRQRESLVEDPAQSLRVPRRPAGRREGRRYRLFALFPFNPRTRYRC